MIRRKPSETDADSEKAAGGGRRRPSAPEASTSVRRERLGLLDVPVGTSPDAGGDDGGDGSASTDGDRSSSSSGGGDPSDVDIVEDEEEAGATHGRRLCWSLRVVAVLSVLCLSAVSASLWMVSAADDRSPATTTRLQGKAGHGKDGTKRQRDGGGGRLPVDFECPAQRQKAVNADEDEFEQEYAIASRQVSTNLTEFLETFRGSKFDSWGRSYETVKAGMEDFKARYYPPYLRNGSTIYESACGIGLNLYMTMEILRDRANLTHLVVYGNEYVPESAEKANWVLDQVAPADGRKGVVCAGDSSNLSHVPSDAFDLVYTGYVTPLMDPLNLHPDAEYTRYNQICTAAAAASADKKSGTAAANAWMGETLTEIIQQRQEDWYGTWVGEMARIAKRGAPVIVEQVSPSYCSATNDWGGVDRDFWKRHAEADTYRWDVDPASIEIVKDRIFKARYNVFMVKNG